MSTQAHNPKHEAAIRMALSVYYDAPVVDKFVAYITSPAFDRYCDKGYQLVSIIQRAKWSAGHGAGMSGTEKAAVTRALKHYCA